tara:strand:- start:1484 stop:1618 length:135 start_codon:yes stop_codon:yes gene_type:complete
MANKFKMGKKQKPSFLLLNMLNKKTNPRSVLSIVFSMRKINEKN